MTDHDDRYEEEQAAREIIAYEEACAAGYKGTLEDFRRDIAAQSPDAETPFDSEDDIPF